MKDHLEDLVLNSLLAVGCFGISYLFFSYAAEAGTRTFGIRADTDTLVFGLLSLINLGHFLCGYFHTDDDIGSVAPSRTGLMEPVHESDRVFIRAMAVLTIGPSVYAQNIASILKETTFEKD